MGRLVVIALLLATPLPASAQERQWPSQTPGNGQNLSVPEHHCSCRADGRFFEVGFETCLNGQMAVCAMEQNVTSWQMTGKTCPISSRPALGRHIALLR